jgi:hypothetical protein
MVEGNGMTHIINKAIHHATQNEYTTECLAQFNACMQQTHIDPNATTLLFLKAYESIHDDLHHVLENHVNNHYILQTFAKISEREQLYVFRKDENISSWYGKAKVIGECLAAAEYFYYMLYGAHDDYVNNNPFFSKISKLNGLAHIDQACRKMSDPSLDEKELSKIHSMTVCKANSKGKDNNIRQAIDACFYFSALANGMKITDIKDEKNSLIMTRFNMFLQGRNNQQQYSQLIAIIEQFYPEKLLEMIIIFSKNPNIPQHSHSILRWCVHRITERRSHHLIIKQQLCDPWLSSESHHHQSELIQAIAIQTQHLHDLFEKRVIRINNLYTQITKLHQLCLAYITAQQMGENNTDQDTPQEESAEDKQQLGIWATMAGIIREIIADYRATHTPVEGDPDDISCPIMQDVSDLMHRADFLRQAILINADHNHPHRITRK